MNNQTFDPRMWVILMQHYQTTRKQAAAIPIYASATLMHGLVAIGAMLFEWELMVSVFEKIVGEQSEYFSPAVMGTTSFILVVAIHYLTEENKHKRLIRRLDNAVAIVAPVYLLGIGVLLAVLLFNDGGIADMLEYADMEIDFEAVASEEKSWLTALIENIASPVASLLFSFGIGTLVITNVFIAHRAIGKVSVNAKLVVMRSAALKADRVNIQTYKQEKKLYQSVLSEISRYETDDEALKLKTASEIVMEVSSLNRSNKKLLEAHKARQEAFNPLPDTLPQINIKDAEKVVKAIDDITIETLMKLMK